MAVGALVGTAVTVGQQTGAFDAISGWFGGDGTVSSCSGQPELAARIRTAMQNAPAADRSRFLNRFFAVDPTASADPNDLAWRSLGGDDCKHSRNSQQLVGIVQEFTDQYGSPQSATSWTPAEPGDLMTTQAPSSNYTSQFEGPGAPLGIPVWAWILILVGVVVVATGKGGGLSA